MESLATTAITFVLVALYVLGMLFCVSKREMFVYHTFGAGIVASFSVYVFYCSDIVAYSA